MEKNVEFGDLLGKTLVSIQQSVDELIFKTTEGETYKSYHYHHCCESVGIEDIEGDLNDLLNAPLTQAEEITNSEDKMGKVMSESFTWTFYKLATIKGYVTIRWLGESNGYYSESVDFVKV